MYNLLVEFPVELVNNNYARSNNSKEWQALTSIRLSLFSYAIMKLSSSWLYAFLKIINRSWSWKLVARRTKCGASHPSSLKWRFIFSTSPTRGISFKARSLFFAKLGLTCTSKQIKPLLFAQFPLSFAVNKKTKQKHLLDGWVSSPCTTITVPRSLFRSPWWFVIWNDKISRCRKTLSPVILLRNADEVLSVDDVTHGGWRTTVQVFFCGRTICTF